MGLMGKMHPDCSRIQENGGRRNSKDSQIQKMEAVGEKCKILNNFSDSHSGVSAVSSFTRESQREECVKNHSADLLRQKIEEKLPDIVQGIRTCDRSWTGKILPVDLYDVLRVFCYPLTLKDFTACISQDQLDENGLVSYKSFLSSFVSDEKRLESLLSHKGDESSDFATENALLSTEDLEIKIKNKIGRSLKTFVRCLWLHDPNGDGLVEREHLKAALDAIGCPLADEQFGRFWSLFDPTNSGLIRYKDFLLKLGSHAESYKRIVPPSKRNQALSLGPGTKYSKNEQVRMLCAKLGRDDPAVRGQFLTRVLQVFKERVRSEFPALLRALQIKDSGGTGLLPLSVFHQVLNYFVMPTSPQLFKEILRSFNVAPDSKIAWYSFLKKLSVDTEVNYEKNQSPLKGSVSWKICKSVLEKLKSSGKNGENFFKHAFTVPTQNQKLCVTRSELRRVINSRLPLPVSEEEFRALAFVLDPSHTNLVECDAFLRLLAAVGGRPSDEGSRNSKLANDEDFVVESQTPDKNLSGEKLKAVFKKCFNKNYKNIDKALCAFDSEESGAVNMEDLKKILDVFCFPLTDGQFCELVADFAGAGNKIFYGDFTKSYKKSPYEDEEKWRSCVGRLLSPAPPGRKLSQEELWRCVRDRVAAHRDDLLREFQEQDVCGAGGARKELLHRMLHKYAFRISDEQFDALWEKLPKNEIGFLKYAEFLDEWCTDVGLVVGKAPSRVSSGRSSVQRRPHTAGSSSSAKSSAASTVSRPRSAASLADLSADCSVLTKEQYKLYKSMDFGGQQRPPSRTKSRVSSGRVTPKVERKVEYERTIETRWRDILRRCRAVDPDSLPWDDFRAVLQRTGVDADSEEVLTSLERKYGVRRGSSVNYWMFLKKFVLKPDTKQAECSPGLCKVLLGHRDRILRQHRDLKHAFRRADPFRTGSVGAPEFRRILALHGIRMTDSDLFYVQDHFDPRLTERIPYDIFLAAFR